MNDSSSAAQKKPGAADARFVQQHLANERTLLAWIRTSIAVIGIGFLAAGVLFTPGGRWQVGNIAAAAAAIGATLIGLFLLVFAMLDYFRKQRGINGESFRAPRRAIAIVCGLLVSLNVLLGAIVVMLLLDKR